MTTRRVLLVEDEEGLGQALEYQLGAAGFRVTRATNGVDGLEAFDNHRHDLVLLDLMLPRMSGDEVCRRIRARSDVPIIMLTARDSETEKLEGFGLGADDYVTKPFSTPELLARIRAVLRRDRSASGTASITVGDIHLDLDRREVLVGTDAHHLPRKEFELLRLLMQRAGRVVTREDLLEDVWGGDYVGDTRTLDVHIKRVRKKLVRPDNEQSPIQTVRGVGFKFVL